MKFLLLLSITVIFVATGAEGLKCKCCTNTDCPDTDCDDNGENSIQVDCQSRPYNLAWQCYTQKRGLKICFFDAVVIEKIKF